MLNAGRIEQVGSPLELYNHPANLFVAGFIGSPRMNLFEPPAGMNGAAATIGVRPEHIDVSREKGQWRGKVDIAEHLGSDTFFHIDVEKIGRADRAHARRVRPDDRRTDLAYAEAGAYSPLRRQGACAHDIETGFAGCISKS